MRRREQKHSTQKVRGLGFSGLGFGIEGTFVKRALN